MKEMHRILKFTNLESSKVVKVFCIRPTDFFLLEIIFTLLNFFLISNKFEDLLRQARYIIEV